MGAMALSRSDIFSLKRAISLLSYLLILVSCMSVGEGFEQELCAMPSDFIAQEAYFYHDKVKLVAQGDVVVLDLFSNDLTCEVPSGVPIHEFRYETAQFLQQELERISTGSGQIIIGQVRKPISQSFSDFVQEQCAALKFPYIFNVQVQGSSMIGCQLHEKAKSAIMWRQISLSNPFVDTAISALYLPIIRPMLINAPAPAFP